MVGVSGDDIIEDRRCYLCGWVVHGNCPGHGNKCAEDPRNQMASECFTAMALCKQSLAIDAAANRPKAREMSADFIWTRLPARFLQ